jgi:hypothetical protein
MCRGKPTWLMGIGQSNIGIAGVDVGTTYYTVPSEIDDIQRFAISRGGNGDPVQSGVQIPAGALRGFTELADASGSANMPTTLMAWLANRRENRLGLTKLRRVARIDALGVNPADLSAFRRGKRHLYGRRSKVFTSTRATRQAGYAAAQALGDTFTHRIVMVHGEDTSIATDQYETYLSSNLIDRHYADAVTDVGTPPASFVIADQRHSCWRCAAIRTAGPPCRNPPPRWIDRGSRAAVSDAALDRWPALSVHRQPTMADLHNYVDRQVAAMALMPPGHSADFHACPCCQSGHSVGGVAAGTVITGLGTGMEALAPIRSTIARRWHRAARRNAL